MSVHSKANQGTAFLDLQIADSQAAQLRIPPNSIEAEQSVIGGLLLDNSAFDSIADVLSESDFYRDDHRCIYRHITSLIERGQPADVLTVFDAIEQSADKGKAGGLAYLGRLAQNTPSAHNIKSYAAIVRDKARRREISALGAELQERAAAPGKLSELCKHAEARLEKIGSFSNGDNLLEAGFWACDCKVTLELPYVLKGIIAKGQFVVLWGAPGSGKSFTATELLCAIGAGSKWRGRRTGGGICMYVVAESTRPHIENRFSALKQEFPSMADSAVLIVPLALDLLHAERGDVDRVIETARLLAEHDGEVVLIAIDTLNVTIGGGDENGPDMGVYVANIKRIIAETGAAVLVLHHCGKDEARGMRGHSALLGALDAELAIEGEAGGQHILRTGKVRDGESHADLFAFTLRRVELGMDSDGEPVTTCVLESLDESGTRRARQQRKGAGLGKHQKAVLRALETAGGRMPRLDLAHKLKDEGMPRQRVSDAIGALLECGMLIAHNDVTPAEVSIQ
ncbi:MAG: DnaB-like helicase N-terminal domain-containing protein [Burkholderiales bacterium]